MKEDPDPGKAGCGNQDLSLCLRHSQCKVVVLHSICKMGSVSVFVWSTGREIKFLTSDVLCFKQIYKKYTFLHTL